MFVRVIIQTLTIVLALPHYTRSVCVCVSMCVHVYIFVCTRVSDPWHIYQRFEQYHDISPLLLTSVWSVCMHKVRASTCV